ncbi:LysR family transcriptional regulator [Thiohalomonas denitrificans]|uniref:LysR family transcriptional regulator n=1 Tax=Thiohalomonas denitrificans TaxID=415747 RepID=UPI0026EB2DDF|nr:LysR family transcriptional regulator [Thiohalomonas denitrificans]
MGPMSDFDYLSLDGRSLRLFVAVLESGSVTAAAERLGVTQSAVSHTLEKLRNITGDPLFVKSGRGIVATAYAETLGERARSVLEGMKAIAQPPDFNPVTARREFTVAANDFQRDLLLPRVLRSLCEEAPGIRLRVIPAGIPEVELLREDRCNLIITPRPPQGSDVHTEQLLEDRLVCFYDGRQTQPPGDLAAYLAARHIGLQYEDSEKADFEKQFRALGIHRDVAVVVDNVAGIPAFMRGTGLLAILPSMLDSGLMREFAWCEPPFALDPLPLFQVWHRRHDEDAAHCWLRAKLTAAAEEVVKNRSPRLQWKPKIK